MEQAKVVVVCVYVYAYVWYVCVASASACCVFVRAWVCMFVVCVRVRVLVSIRGVCVYVCVWCLFCLKASKPTYELLAIAFFTSGAPVLEAFIICVALENFLVE